MSGAVELPVACTLGTAELEERRAEWRALIDSSLRERSRTPAGVRLGFEAADGVAERLRHLAGLESECCEFAEWRVSEDADAVVLDVASTGEGIAAVRELFAA